MQFFFVVIVLFPLFSDNLGLSLSMISLKFFTSLELPKTLTLPFRLEVVRRHSSETKGKLAISGALFLISHASLC